MFGPIEPGQSRWLRLRPADPGDVLLGLLMVFGLMVYVSAWFTDPPSVPWTWLQPVSDGLFLVHGSTPVFFFVGALVYLNRWGRSVRAHKKWIVIGFVLTVPLWFLGGLPLAVKGAGDITALLVPWNLLALALMLVGVHRSLRGAPQKEIGVRS